MYTVNADAQMYIRQTLRARFTKQGAFKSYKTLNIGKYQTGANLSKSHCVKYFSPMKFASEKEAPTNAFAKTAVSTDSTPVVS